MKRILQIVGSLEVGGLQAVAMNCMRYSDRKQFHFDFLVCSESVGFYEEEAKKCGCSVFRLADGISHLQFFREVKRIINMNEPYDVVYSHIFMNSGLALLAAKMCGVKKCVAHAHSIQRSDGREIKRRLYYSLMRVFLSMFADVKIACSEAAGKYVFGDNSSFTVINNGIDFEKFRFDPKVRDAVREKLGVSSCFLVGTVGRFFSSHHRIQ